MGIEYFHPDHKKLVHMAKFACEGVNTSGDSFYERVTKNSCAIFSDGRIKLENNSRGAYFEIVLFDGIAASAKGDTSRIKTGVRDSRPNRNAEVDFIVSGCGRRMDMAAGIHAKTSLRERWRQPDRDTLVIKSNKDTRELMLSDLCDLEAEIKFWLLGYKEYDENTPSEAVRALSLIHI